MGFRSYRGEMILCDFLDWPLAILIILNLMHHRSLHKFLAYVKPYRWMIAGATLCGLLKYNIPVAFPWVLKDVIDHLVSPAESYTLKLNLTMMALILLYFVWAAVTYLRSYLADQVGQRLIFDLRNALYVHLQRMSLGFFERRQGGRSPHGSLGTSPSRRTLSVPPLPTPSWTLALCFSS
jgi:ABC-type multidrug transport system fused ATPase/permease subunit